VTDRKRAQRLAEAKRTRQQARRTAARRRRLLLIGVVLLTLIAGVGLAIGLLGRGDDATLSAEPTPSPQPTGVESTCAAPGEPRADDLRFDDYDRTAGDGVTGLNLETNCGRITIGLDSRSPQTAASMAFLADNGYFDGIRCHRVTTAGIFVLQCGDPAGDGTGGPGYTVPDENLPPINDNGVAVYPRGTVAMANRGPGTSGSQFFIVYRDSPLPPNYTVWGQVSAGIDTVDYVADGGVSGGGTDGQPARPLQISSVTLRS
jgi:peptidyl-prolyl cis-trans isomerase B (cyclophilin B)